MKAKFLFDYWSLIFKKKRDKKRETLHKPFLAFLGGSANLQAAAHLSEAGIEAYRATNRYFLKVADRTSVGYNDEGK